MGELRTVSRSSLHPSPSNPRKTFVAIEELAESIGEKGVLQPLLVRRLPGASNGELEVIAGERRRRACELAGVDDVPVMIGEFDDAEVLELQVVENDQREDVHPLEEADGFAALRDQHGRSVADIAARIGRPEAYVHRRLILTQLGKTARKLLAKGDLSIGVAEVVARIPNAKLQNKAAGELAHDHVTIRSARDSVRRRYMLRLHDAPWKIDDAELLPAAGACSSCPKRTGAQAYLFPEVEKDDLCIDPACWKKKEAAHGRARIKEAKAAGANVLTAAEAKKVWPQQWSKPTGYLDLDERPDWQTSKHTRAVLGKRLDEVPITLAKNPHNGQLVELVRPADVKKAVRAEPHKSDPDCFLPREKKELTPAEKKRKTEAKKEAAIRDAKDAAHAEALTALVDKLCSNGIAAEPLELWRLVAEGLVLNDWWGAEDVAKRRGLEVEKGKPPGPPLTTYIAGEKEQAQLVALVLELLVDSELHGLGVRCHRSEGPGFAQRVLERFGVDWLAMEKKAFAKAKADLKPKPKKRAKRPAKKKTAKRAPARSSS